METSSNGQNGNNNGKPSNKTSMDELLSKMTSFVSQLSAFEGVEHNGNGYCRHVDSSPSDEDSDSDNHHNGGGTKDYFNGFDIDSDEFSDGNCSLDDDYMSDKKMKDMMQQMDAELAGTALGKEDVRSAALGKVLSSNLSKSCQAENGRPGPAGVLLKQLNIKMASLGQLDSDDDDE